MSTWQTVVIAVAIIQICLGTTTIYAKENAVCTAETNKVIESKIGYIRKDIPSFTIPPYKGQYYQDMVPYTLDLAEMATLTINGLTEMTDPCADCEQYFWVKFSRDPVVMVHDFSDGCQTKFLEALPLLRIVSGSNLNSQVDPVWMQTALKSIGPDGLYYLTTNNRPWALLGGWGDPVWKSDGSAINFSETSVTQFSVPTFCGRTIGAMTVYYLRDRNPLWKQTIENMIERLNQLAVDKGDYAYFPMGVFEPNASVPPDVSMPIGMGSGNCGWVIQGLAQYYQATGYEPARKLARKLAVYLKEHGRWYDTEGRFLEEQDPNNSSRTPYSKKHLNKYGGHFHIHALPILGILDYALAANDKEMLEFARKGFEYGRDSGNGSKLVGFFPENIEPNYPTSETCEIADMIALAVKLSQGGIGDYWDDADRWVRNQFVENQLTRIDWIMTRPQDGLVRKLEKRPVAFNETSEKAAERSIGGFAGWPSAGDWDPYDGGIMNCCTGNAARAIYYVWENIIDYKKNQLRINLLLNRVSPWADIYSHIPYKGQVDIKIKKTCASVAVRLPEWIEKGSQSVKCEIDGKQCQINGSSGK